MYHQAVMLHEAVQYLAVKPGGYYADFTYGGGGHSREILCLLGDGRLVAFDQDEDALSNRIDDPRLTLIHSNFRFAKNYLTLYKTLPLDGILVDLGVSSHQIDDPKRGFSTRFEAPLDMRMSQSAKISAYEIIRSYPEAALTDIFRMYGEIANARQLSSRICSVREAQPIATTFDLIQILKAFTSPHKINKYTAQVFQALRIEVNGELKALRAMLEDAGEILKPGGRLVIISYHSLEDRLVKNFMKWGNTEGEPVKDFFGNVHAPFIMLTRKPCTPSEEEITLNPRSRSARLRAAERMGR